MALYGGMSKEMNIRYAIYKYVYNGKVVYIGKTNSSLNNRIKAHLNERKFQDYLSSAIYYFECNNRIETSIYEKYLINKYKPILNEADKIIDRVLIDIKEPEWKEYKNCKEISLNTFYWNDERRNRHNNSSKEKLNQKIKLLEKEIDFLIWLRDRLEKTEAQENTIRLRIPNAETVFQQIPTGVYFSNKNKHSGRAIFTSVILEEDTIYLNMNADGIEFFKANYDKIIEYKRKIINKYFDRRMK